MNKSLRAALRDHVWCAGSRGLRQEGRSTSRLRTPARQPPKRRSCTSSTGRTTSPKTRSRTSKQKTGIKVTYDVFDSNDVLETRLLAGNSGFDVVVPSASFLERQIKAGVFQKLDKSQLPNLKNMDPEIMQRVALHDPNNEHSVPYLWGTTGIGYNEAKVKKILGETPLDTWNFIFDPKLSAKFKDCGISVLDAPDELLKIALAWMGRDPNSQKQEDLKAAEEKLVAIRPYIRKIHSSQYIEDLANGELCVAVGWSGDILQARDRAAEAGQGVVVKYSIPKEGTIVWFDMLAIPADAKHPTERPRLHQLL